MIRYITHTHDIREGWGGGVGLFGGGWLIHTPLFRTMAIITFSFPISFSFALSFIIIFSVSCRCTCISSTTVIPRLLRREKTFNHSKKIFYSYHFKVFKGV